ncbi:MAG: hypothetical protein KDJ52_27265, partial [Anaerolineae bacterium]|nr:hypothetical protein [Anaerolineae bacterium]
MINWLKRLILLVMLTALAIVGVSPHLTALTPALAYQIDQSDIPQIEAIYNFGVPAGNGATPRHLALNSKDGLVYILNGGLPSLAEGNGLSVFDIATGEIIEHTTLNEGNNEPLSLQFDPASGFIYALWRETLDDSPTTLGVIDSQSLEIKQVITGVKAMAVAENMLYTATEDQLTRFNASTGLLTESWERELSSATPGPLAVDQANDRLYFARSTQGVWSLDIFEAETLEPIVSYPAEGQILKIFPTPTTDEVILIVNINEFMVIYRLTLDGELADFPFEIGPRYGATGIAMAPDESALYFSKGQPAPANLSETDNSGPALGGLTVDTLLPLDDIPLLTTFDAIVVDADTKQAFALYPFDDILYQIDLEEAAYTIVKTAIELKDVLLDAAQERIFVSDTANRIRILDSDTLEVLDETTLTGNTVDYGFERGRGSGQLALDAERERLYVSGYPATVVDSNELVELATLDQGGQVVPNPTTDDIYLTNCGITILEADTLSGETLIPGSGPVDHAPVPVPDPCVVSSRLDAENQWLYGIVSNRVSGSNAGTYLQVYDNLALEPTRVFTDPEISIRDTEPDESHARAFITYVRESHRRLRTLDMTASPVPTYVNQLLGVHGDVRYDLDADRLYLSDVDQARLLTLDADSLNVLGETRLPPHRSYRLVEIDPDNQRLFLIGLGGELLVAAPGSTPDAAIEAMVAPEPEEPHLPDGSVLAVDFSDKTTVARIESSVTEFTYSTRLYMSDDDGKNWADLSTTLPQLPVSAVALSPDFETDQTIFVGLLSPGQTGGLYKSTDGGQSWQAAMNGLRDVWVEALTISPNFSDDQLIFARTTYGGLHQSLDGGKSWTALAELSPSDLFPAASAANPVAFSDNGTILASQSLPDVVEGVFLSTLQSDGTLSEWLPVLDVPAELLALSPEGDVALAFANGLWRSTDGGLTWEAGGQGLVGIDNLTPVTILFSPNFEDNQTVYFFFRDTSSGATSLLFRSTDAGQTWQPWQKPFMGRNFASAAFAPDGDFIFGEENGDLARLSTTALVWTTPQPAPKNIPVDDLVASPDYENDETLFFVNSRQGLYKTTDGGQSWEQTPMPVRGTGTGLTHYDLAVSPNFADDETLYVATGRSLHRSTDGGDSWQQVPLDTGSTTEHLTFQAQQVAFSPKFADDKTLYAATAQAVYRSTDGGDTWVEVLGQEEGSSTTDLLAVGPVGETVYARFGYSRSLFISTTGGDTWQVQTTPDEYFTVVSGAVGPDKTLSIALEFDNRLLQSDPQAQGWQTAVTPKELTSLTTVSTAPDGTLWVGGDSGIFYSDDNGQSWQPATDEGLPPDSTITH